MIDEIIKELLELTDVTITSEKWMGEVFHKIHFTEKTAYHFDFIREVEAIARMNNYDLFIGYDGFTLHPKE